MINLPTPYAEELIYSTVARYKIRAGLISPKQLLDDVFEDRGVVATIDLPCHLSKIANHYPHNLFNLNYIAYQHTLFPLYAPFIPESRRQECLKWMANHSQGAIHLAIGNNASRLPSVKYIRYCPQCFNEQFKDHGEWYWSRMWQIPGITCCSAHGSLADSSVEYRSNSRHDFIAASPHNCVIKQQESVSKDDRFLISKVTELLLLEEQPSPTFEQWTAFYHGLARFSNCMRGSKHIDHLRILEKVENRWSLEFLKTNNLHRLNSETGWLRGIFRKHRKSFSYLEHIIAISSLLEQEWTFEEIIMQVKSQKTTLSGKITEAKNTIKPDSELVKSNRNLWLDLIKEHQLIKEARKVNKALYAWLYRNDKTWFIDTNKRYHQRYVPEGFTIDWQKRDIELVKSLIKINDQVCFDLALPRKSKKWWMNQTDLASTIEKNQDKLPLVSAFLNRYSEDVSDYQIRRLSHVLIDSVLNNQTLQRWEILRLAKLSDERITSESLRFLEHAYSITNMRINKVSI